jgi:predicted DNA-binding antitoxin AbrB/MazE fold protein
MFYENNKYGYADKTGKVIIEAKYDAGVLYKENKKVVFSAGSFSEGLAGVNINDKYGFIDKTGKVVIEPKFNSVGDFEGLASVYDYEKGKNLALLIKKVS